MTYSLLRYYFTKLLNTMVWGKLKIPCQVKLGRGAAKFSSPKPQGRRICFKISKLLTKLFNVADYRKGGVNLIRGKFKPKVNCRVNLVR